MTAKQIQYGLRCGLQFGTNQGHFSWVGTPYQLLTYNCAMLMQNMIGDL